jgi:hypothetical protein
MAFVTVVDNKVTKESVAAVEEVVAAQLGAAKAERNGRCT